MLRRSDKFVIVGLFGGDATFAQISMLFKWRRSGTPMSAHCRNSTS
jgi:hypothetical protein